MICKDVPNLGIDFSFTLYDDTREYTYHLKWSTMFVTGLLVNDFAGTCYMPIFYHGQTGSTEDN